MLLSEVFNQPVKWKYIKDTSDIVLAKFMVGDLGYTFRAAVVDTSPETTWDVDFRIGLPDEYGVSGTGYQQQVFATIIDIMSDFITNHSPKIITLKAEEPNRMQLYLRMFKRLLPTWEVKVDRIRIWIYHPSIKGKV